MRENGAFCGGAAASRAGNIVLGLGSVLAPLAGAPTFPGYQDATAEQVRAQRWHRNRTRKIQALGLLSHGPPALPIIPPDVNDPADSQAAWFRLRQKRVVRKRLVVALLYQHGYDVDPINTAPVFVIPKPDDAEDHRAALYRRRQKRLLRRKVREILFYQHRFDVDVINPFLVARTVRSMLSAGAWEPGGY